jgi:site-specific recombinase XerD
MKNQPNSLARGLRDFFAQHLPEVRGMSPHTIQGYRDSQVLLIRFVAKNKKCSAVKLDVSDLTSDQIIRFLRHLEEDRKNSASTRNVRLAAIHSFFRYLAEKFPDQLEHCQRVLAIPFKRSRTRPVEYLEYNEIQAVLASVDRSTLDGRRDYALIATMFNTGARIQELLNLRCSDLQLTKPSHVRFFGKGNKERICPMWPETARLLKDLILEQGFSEHSKEQIFLNHCGQPLTRYGARYLLAKYCNLASKTTATLRKKRLHPHCMRHSTAVHLLKAGVDVITISHWLGHASIETTNRYATVDLAIKREAINKAAGIKSEKEDSPTAPWRKNTSVLDWLESL